MKIQGSPCVELTCGLLHCNLNSSSFGDLKRRQTLATAEEYREHNQWKCRRPQSIEQACNSAMSWQNCMVQAVRVRGAKQPYSNAAAIKSCSALGILNLVASVL